jgi:hypothetical protein
MVGLVFSILSTFDGVCPGLPTMDITLRPHESDQGFRQRRGENWFQPGMCINPDTLHHEWIDYTKSAGLSTAP